LFITDGLITGMGVAVVGNGPWGYRGRGWGHPRRHHWRRAGGPRRGRP